MSFPIGYYSMSGKRNELFRHVTGQYASLESVVLKKILRAPAMGLKVLNELRNFLLEHVFPSLQFTHVRLAPYGRRISKESLLLKKECYPRVLRTLLVRCCTNEEIGKEMNVISDWLL